MKRHLLRLWEIRVRLTTTLNVTIDLEPIRLQVRCITCRLKIPRAPCWYKECMKVNYTGVQCNFAAWYSHQQQFSLMSSDLVLKLLQWTEKLIWRQQTYPSLCKKEMTLKHQDAIRRYPFIQKKKKPVSNGIIEWIAGSNARRRGKPILQTSFLHWLNTNSETRRIMSIRAVRRTLDFPNKMREC